MFSGRVGGGSLQGQSRERGAAAPGAQPVSPPQILIQSVCETMVPKLVAEDIPLLFSLLSDVFPGVQYHRGEMTALREELKKVCQEMYLTYGDGEEVGGMWVEKVSGAAGLAGASQMPPLPGAAGLAGASRTPAPGAMGLAGASQSPPGAESGSGPAYLGGAASDGLCPPGMPSGL